MRRWIIGIIILIAVGAGAYFLLAPGEQAEEEDTAALDELEPVLASDSVVAEAEVVPVRDVELQFETGGTIADVLVAENDPVDRGDIVARLDSRDMELQVEEAQASLAQARADLELLLDGATDEELAAAQADVTSAEAGLARSQAAQARREAEIAQRQADVARQQAEVARAAGELQRTRGEVTQADIAEAEASLAAAREELADLEDGADEVDIQSARAVVAQREANLKTTRDQLSAAKVSAEREVELAANEVRNAQADYQNNYWDIRELERELNTVDQELYQDLRDREERALRAVKDAETRLTQAQISLEAAQREEVTGIQQAEAQLAEAQANLEDVLSPPKAADLAAARATIAQREAALARLTGEQRAGQLAAAAAAVSSAEANVSAAQASVNASQADLESSQADIDASQADIERSEANLDDLAAPPRQPNVDDREAAVLQREVALRQAERELEKSELIAPMDGTVVEVNLEAGERIDTTRVAVRIADFSEWEVVTTDLTELGVVRIEVGDPAEITFDALPDLTLDGVVKSVQDIGKNQQGDIVYEVTVTPLEWDNRLRWGMTATVSIVPEDVESTTNDDTDTSSDEADTSSDETTE